MASPSPELENRAMTMVFDQKWNEKLVTAIKENNLDLAEELLGKSPKIDKKKAALFALFAAIQNHDQDPISFLMKHTDPVGTISSQDHTALHQAVIEQDIDIVRAVLFHANVSTYIDARDSEGWSALHIAANMAAKDGNTEIMEELLANRADIDAPDNRHQTPLHVVVYENTRKEPVSFLLRNDAEVNTKDVSGDSPLHDAVKHNDQDLVKLLLEYGADPDIVNVDGETPRDLAASLGHEDRVGYLFAIIEPRKTERPFRTPTCTGERAAISKAFKASVRFYYEKRANMCWAKSVPVYDLVYTDRATTLEQEYIAYLEKCGVRVEEQDHQYIWKWIHFPATNMTWVKDLIWRLTDHRDDKEHTWTFFQDNILERRQEGLAGCTRMPEVKDSRKYLAKMEQDSQAQAGKSLPNLETISEQPWSPGGDTQMSPSQPPTLQVSTSAEKPTPAGGDRIDKDKVEDYTIFKKGEKPGPDGWRGTKTTFPRDRKLSLVFPYIDFETEYYIYRDDPNFTREDEIEFQKPQFRRMKELDRLYAPYKGMSGLQGFQTLDETYYWMLGRERLRERDADQVIYKWTKGRINSSRKGRPAPEMPEQLQKHNATATTKGSRQHDVDVPKIKVEASSTPPAQNGINPLEDQGSQNGSHISLPSRRPRASQQSNRAWKGAKEIEIPKPVPMLITTHQLWVWKITEKTVITAMPERWHTGSQDTLLDTIRQSGLRHFVRPEQLIAHIVHHCARFLDQYTYAGFGQHILDIFETEIARLADQEALMFQEFQRSLDETIVYDIDHEINILCELKDIHDELHLLRRIFENQRDVLDKFAHKFWHGGQENWRQLRHQFYQDSRIEALMKRVSRLDEDAQRTHDSLDYLIQTKQAQGGLQEAEAAGKLNNYIMLFTVITIIFTPLSFMTALFAIPLQSFRHNPETGEMQLEAGWFTKRMIVGEIASLALILIGVWLYWLYIARRTRRQVERRKLPSKRLGAPVNGSSNGGTSSGNDQGKVMGMFSRSKPLLSGHGFSSSIGSGTLRHRGGGMNGKPLSASSLLEVPRRRARSDLESQV